MHAVMNSRKWLILIGRYAFGFGILGYFFYKIEFSNVLIAISNTDSRFLFAGLIFALGVRILQAWQLSVGIRHQKTPINIRKTFEINLICQFYGLFLPSMVVGAGVRWYKLYKHTGKRAETFSAILFIRFINTFLMLIIGTCAVLIENPFGLQRFFWIGIFIIGAMGVCYIGLFNNRITDKMEYYIKHMPVWIPDKLREGFREFFLCVFHFKHLAGKQAIKLFTVPVGIIIFSIFTFFFVAKSIHQCIPIISLIWIVSIVYIIHLIPISISGLGLREGALVLILPNYGINESSALALSLIIFAINLLFGLIGGVMESRELFFGASKRTIESDKRSISFDD